MPTAAKSAIGPDDPDAIDRARRACLATSLLEPVGQAADHRAADTEEAVAARQAGGDMPLVREVAGVDLKPPGAGLVADHGIEQGVIRLERVHHDAVMSGPRFLLGDR